VTTTRHSVPEVDLLDIPLVEGVEADANKSDASDSKESLEVAERSSSFLLCLGVTSPALLEKSQLKVVEVRHFEDQT
jgi:hypothetical protein